MERGAAGAASRSDASPSTNAAALKGRMKAWLIAFRNMGSSSPAEFVAQQVDLAARLLFRHAHKPGSSRPASFLHPKLVRIGDREHRTDALAIRIDQDGDEGMFFHPQQEPGC